jgi:hypothetical protein
MSYSIVTYGFLDNDPYKIPTYGFYSANDPNLATPLIDIELTTSIQRSYSFNSTICRTILTTQSVVRQISMRVNT